jgi:hypothetical protein
MPAVDLIDVSQSNGKIDYARVAKAPIIGAYIRAGESLSYDSAFRTHAKGFAAQSIPFGFYWALHPDKDPEKQAKMLADVHAELDGQLAPMCDFELSGSLTKTELSAALMRFLITCDTQTVRTGIYTAPYFWNTHIAHHAGEALDIAAPFRNRVLWLAQYTYSTIPDIPWPWDEYSLWQYRANTIWSDGSFGPTPKNPDAHKIMEPGHCDGVPTECDLNLLGNTTLTELGAGVPPKTPLDYRNVRDRQRALRRCGVFAGKLDGLWGPSSRAGLVLVQRKLGISETGIWDPSTEWKIAETIG